MVADLYIVVPLVLLLGWLFGEFRARTSIRVGLALAFILSMVPMLYYPFGPARLADIPLAVHRGCLHKAEGLLQQGNCFQVEEAFRAYRETYERTRDEWMALDRMQSILASGGSKPGGGKRDTSNFGGRAGATAGQASSGTPAAFHGAETCRSRSISPKRRGS
jgi:hypothetical protein